MIEPVGKVEHLSYVPKLCERVRSLRSKGMVASQIARRLNDEGYRPPKRREGSDTQSAQNFIHRLGLSQRRMRSEGRKQLGQHESWLEQFTCEIGMPEATLYGWLRRGQLKARQQEKAPYRCIVRADETGVERLKCLRTRLLGNRLRELWVGASSLRTDTHGACFVEHGSR